ncbi:MAG: RsmB/NOP family class I SAM-dependent RNA methyltransferase [Spirochaetia bacterium]|nr:RsmB/NOP family class I SAM-dependent RNA methyltransferase [Spirochaetia bacterium]
MSISKLHPHLIKGITEALIEIFKNGRYADKIVEITLKSHPKWGARDRRFFAESVYECVRWRRRLFSVAFTAENFIETDSYLDQNFLTYERIEKMWYAWWLIRNSNTQQNVFSIINTGKNIYDLKIKFNVEPLRAWQSLDSTESIRSIKESIPDWLDATGEKELGSKWATVLNALNAPASVYLRINQIKTNRETLVKELQKEEVFTETVNDENALRLKERKNVFITTAFKAGFFEVQDLGSQKIVPFLEVEPGMRVIDACAGGGGKSLHMASLMHNKGKIIALDKNDWRLTPLRQRASRAGADIIETRIITSNKIIKRLFESADRLLLDVPCTGTGVLRRSPDTKWKLTFDEMSRLLETQQEIIQNYSSMTAKGGIMVYSTCSIFPSENQKQIDIFLNSPAGKDWQFIEELNIYPSTEYINNEVVAPQPSKKELFLNSDGFYMAKLKRLAKK